MNFRRWGSSGTILKSDEGTFLSSGPPMIHTLPHASHTLLSQGPPKVLSTYGINSRFRISSSNLGPGADEAPWVWFL